MRSSSFNQGHAKCLVNQSFNYIGSISLTIEESLKVFTLILELYTKQLPIMHI